MENEREDAGGRLDGGLRYEKMKKSSRYGFFVLTHLKMLC